MLRRPTTIAATVIALLIPATLRRPTPSRVDAALNPPDTGLPDATAFIAGIPDRARFHRTPRATRQGGIAPSAGGDVPVVGLSCCVDRAVPTQCA